MSKNDETQARRGFEPKIKVVNVDELQLDDRNANKGTDLGNELLDVSVEKYGIGRGVLADKNLKLIAGNHAVKKIREKGYQKVVVVETDGDTLVVTQRVDVDKDSKEGHELALADNRVTQANLNFDVDVIRELDAEFSLDLADLAININEDGPFFPGGEGEQEAGAQMETSYGENAGTGQKGEQVQTNFFPVMAALTKAQRLQFDQYKKFHDLRTDTEAIIHLLNNVNE